MHLELKYERRPNGARRGLLPDPTDAWCDRMDCERWEKETAEITAQELAKAAARMRETK